jgi:YNFM family putative membrane transporter
MDFKRWIMFFGHRAASMYLSLYYFGGSFGTIIPGLALLWIGWPGVVLLCLVMVAMALGAGAFLCL